MKDYDDMLADLREMRAYLSSLDCLFIDGLPLPALCSASDMEQRLTLSQLNMIALLWYKYIGR